jgi:hypothetical protein
MHSLVPTVYAHAMSLLEGGRESEWDGGARREREGEGGGNRERKGGRQREVGKARERERERARGVIRNWPHDSILGLPTMFNSGELPGGSNTIGKRCPSGSTGALNACKTGIAVRHARIHYDMIYDGVDFLVLV